MSEENELSKGRGSSSSKVSISYRTSTNFERWVSQAAAANKCPPQPTHDFCHTWLFLTKHYKSIHCVSWWWWFHCDFIQCNLHRTSLIPHTVKGLVKTNLWSCITSMHNTTRMHMFQRTAKLDKVLPDSSFRNQPLLFLKMLKEKKIANIRI